MSLNIEATEDSRARRVRIYKKVAENPRYARILGRLQRIGYMPTEELQAHYVRTADTIEKGYHQFQAILRRKAA